MSDKPLITKSRVFALAIMKICKENKFQSVLSNQLLKSGTSIGANVHEANYAHSKPDFIAKMQIALKECYETKYWLTLLIESKELVDNDLLENCLVLRRMLIASVRTAKRTYITYQTKYVYIMRCFQVTTLYYVKAM